MSQFESNKHVEEFHCVIVNMLDDDIDDEDIHSLAGLLKHYSKAPVFTWVFKKGMQYRFADYIEDHHKFFMYKVSKDYKKAKTIFKAL